LKGPGVYVWDGNQWILITCVPEQPDGINGSTNVCPGTANLTYSVVTPVSGVTYTWSVPSGWSITGAETGNSITVTAGSAGGDITVTPSNSCGEGTARTLAVTVNMVDGQGYSYTIALFGNAGCWMTQNLRTTTGLEPGSDNNRDSKFYNYPNLNTSSLANYGLLYTWAAANNHNSATAETGDIFAGAVSTRQGICPTGWHLPSDYEWTQLEEEIANSAENVYSTTDATDWDTSYSTDTGYRGAHGRKMKSLTKVDNSQTTSGTSKTGDAGGFDALLVGYVDSGSAYTYGTNAYVWSSRSARSSNAGYRYLSYGNTGVSRTTTSKYTMLSVRCKQN
jgi:uncharacterized protein (TIGR02145 family)